MKRMILILGILVFGLILLRYLSIKINIFGRQPSSLTYQVQSYTISNYYNDTSTIISNYIRIINDSETECFFWINRNAYDPKDMECAVKEYFYEMPIGKSNPFIDLIKCHNCNLHDMPQTQIGYNFIKNIAPNDEFIILMPNSVSDIQWYKHRFVLLPKEEVINIVKCNIPPNLMYNSAIIELMPLH